MDINIRFFGVPTGFQVFPEPDNIEFYQQFYETVDNYPWRFLIRQNKDIVRFLYIRYNLISHVMRPGSLFGIAIELKQSFINCSNDELLSFLHKFYNKMLEEKILLEKKEMTSFAVSSFSEVSNYLNDKLNVLYQIPEVLKDNLIPLNTNLNSYSPSKIIQFDKNVEDEILNNSFLKYGGINIVPELSDLELTSEIIEISEKEKGFWDDFEREHSRQKSELEQKIQELEGNISNAPNSNYDSQRTNLRKNNHLIIILRNSKFKILGLLLFLVLSLIAFYGINFSQDDDKFVVSEPRTEIPPDSIRGTTSEETEGKVKGELNKANFKNWILSIDELLGKNKFTQALEKIEIEKEDYAGNLKEIDIKINNIKNDRANFIKRKNEFLYKKLIEEVENKVSRNQFSIAIDLLQNSKKKFNSNYKNKIESQINSLVIQRCDFIENAVLWYVENKPYDIENTDEWERKINKAECNKKLRVKLRDHQIYAGYYANYKVDNKVDPQQEIKYGYYKKLISEN